MDLVIISGMSGAGKTKAVNALEDVGYYCVDNIPPRIIPVFTDLCSSNPDKADLQKVAMVVDARSREMFSELGRTLEDMKNSDLPYKILFLDAATDVLVQRYKETRRRHPLTDDERITLRQAVETERQLLQHLKDIADFVIDTSHMLPAQLRERVVGVISEQHDAQPMIINLMSFGYRNGLPSESDLVFDVRCLPNPFYVDELREHTGMESCVRDYVMQFPQSQELIKKLNDLLRFLIPLYIKEGKSQLMIGIGCTGGKHRSVTAVELLGKALQEMGYRVVTTHRDKDKVHNR